MNMLRSAARGGLLAGAAVAVGLCAPQVAAAQSQTAQLGSVSATLRGAGHGRATLIIARAGRTVFRAAVAGGGRATVRVLRLDVTREPQILVQLSTGRSTVDEVFTYQAKKHAYSETSRNFGDSPVRLQVLDRASGRVALVTSDPAFAGRFTDSAHSARPIKVYEVFGGYFGDVTSAYPQLILRDAARWLQAYQRTDQRQDSVGLIAAWAADENELGNMHSADTFLDQEARAGHLNGTRASGLTFVTGLDKFLYTSGYVPMCGGG